jgi:hypothetical protein
MKSLKEIYNQTGIQLKANYYAPYLDTEEIEVIEQAGQEKKPVIYLLNLLRLLALKIIADLKRSPSFYGEQRWKNAFAPIEAALCTEESDSQKLGETLHLADDLIEAASVTRAVRQNILTSVRKHSILSQDQERQYEAIRQAYLAHHEKLIALDQQVRRLNNKFSSPLYNWQAVRRDWPSGLLTYRVNTSQIRLSDQNIARLIYTTKEVREVYQGLTDELNQKPTAEKIAEEIDSAKLFLQSQATAIIQNTGQIRRTLLQHTQQAIEQRSQIKLAHAKKIECLLLALAQIVQQLRSFVSLQKTEPSLSALLKEAKAMQTMLENSSATTASALTKKLVMLNAHREQFVKSISSGWLTMLSSNRQARERQGQMLNLSLQTQIARMTTPVYGFDDQTSVITPEQVKQQQLVAHQLDELQGLADSEREKLENTKNFL